jgi:lipopolysaccharide transport system ATP-binding protein
MSDSIIKVSNLSKSYLLGHEGPKERYTALRDVIARNAKNILRSTGDLLRGKQVVGGDEVEEFWALKDVSFEVKRGEVLGIIGRNGAGKSTLLKILSRITEPTKGRIELNGRVSSLLEVGTGFHPELSGRENIFLNGAILGMTRAEIKRKFDEIVAFAEVDKFLDTPVKRYSSGMYVRLAFAVAAHLDPEILIVDEVLAVGDAEFQKKCLGKMKDVSTGGRTVLFVSHNMHAIQNLCTRAIALKSGSIHSEGETREVIKEYLKSSDMLTEKSFEANELNPSIISVSIDEKELEKENLRVKIGFNSPFELNPPVAGIVIYSSMGTPVFGTNPRFHIVDNDLGKRKNGYLKMDVDKLPIHGGTYSLSVWLGDWETDYDRKEHAVTFEFKKGSTKSNVPNPENIGFIDIAGKWSYLE